MIRHLVLWKIKDCDSPQQRTETLALLKARLETLPKAIKGILDFDVQANDEPSPVLADLSLFSHFDSQASLSAYITHPLHQEVVALLKEHTALKLIADYSVDQKPHNLK